ncbi:hypothetical protein ACPVPU_07020 [Sphingomonas sp. CJ99]
MRKVILGAAAVMLGAGVAHAESVTMEGFFPAPNREASLLTRIGIDRFDGQDGPATALAIERALAGGRHFTVVSLSRRMGGGTDEVDAILSGVVTSGVETNRIQLSREECVEEKDKQCVKKEMKPKQCTRRVINLTADLRLVRREDGAVVMSAERPLRDEVSYCPGENPQRTAEETVRGMIQTIAANLASDITPSVRRYSIRFRESRSGMPKDVGNRFKAAVVQTQRDLPGACAAWAAMEPELPDHPSLAFNLGLCAESRGEFQDALARFQRASQLIGRRGNEGDVGAERVASLIAGEEDRAALAGR